MNVRTRVHIGYRDEEKRFQELGFELVHPASVWRRPTAGPARMDVRNFRPEDLESYATLCNAAEAGDPDFTTLGAEDVRRRVLEDPGYDAAGHFVAFDGGAIAAGGRGVIVRERAESGDTSGRFELHVLPARLGTEAEREVFARIAGYLKGRGVRSIVTRVDTRNVARERMLQRLGFVRTEYENHGMDRDARVAEVHDAPTGYRIRVARMPEEMETLWRVFNEAFSTRKGHVPVPLERFRGLWYLGDPGNYPGFFVAERESDGRAVGIVMSGIDEKFNEEHGARRGGSFALAVVPLERRKGLGTALLFRSVKWIGDAGMTRAYLSVNTANPDALAIYERVGYRSVQVYRGYQIPLP